MRWANVIATQDDREWFEEYVQTALSCRAPKLPPHHQRIGAADATWFPCEEDIALIATTGGSVDDRLLAEIVVREQLRGHGIRQAQFTFDQDEDFRKTADWNDIMAKAKRLIQSGQVQILRNGAQNIVGHVVGDHGEYQTEISREDPNSRAITQWNCDCPWDQYAFQRTRQWKKYEGRPCAHVLGTYWKALATPLDEDAQPAPAQQSLFTAPQQGGPSAPSPFTAPVPPSQGQQMQIPGIAPGMATGTPPGPSGPPPPGQPPDILPPFPMDPSLQPTVNPASVPGLKQPSPTDPVQYPGGTFSSVLSWDFGKGWDFGKSAEPDGWKFAYSTSDGKGAIAPHTEKKPAYHDVLFEQLGRNIYGKDLHFGSVRDDGLVHVWYWPNKPLSGNGPQPNTEIMDVDRHPPRVLDWIRQTVPHAFYPRSFDEQQEGVDFGYRIAADHVNGQIVSTKYDDWGTFIGRSTDHGDGTRAKVPAGSVGEVLGTDPTTGMINVLFENKITERMGPLEPNGVVAWFLPSEVVARPDIKPPGPAVRRR